MLGALCWSFPLSETSCVDWRARAAGRRKKQKKRRSGGSCGCRILGGGQTRAEGRARLYLGTHPAGEKRTVVWAPWFDFISWITALPRWESIIRSRSLVFIGNCTLEVIWKSCLDARKGAFDVKVDEYERKCVHGLFNVGAVSIKVSPLCPVPQLLSCSSACSDSVTAVFLRLSHRRHR